MSTVPAPNGLPPLERHIVIAVAAFVMYGARCAFDLGDGGVARCGLGGLLGGVVGTHVGDEGWRVS